MAHKNLTTSEKPVDRREQQKYQGQKRQTPSQGCEPEVPLRRAHFELEQGYFSARTSGRDTGVVGGFAIPTWGIAG